VVTRLDLYVAGTWRRPFHLTDFGLPLSKVAPVGMPVSKTQLHSLGDYPYDPPFRGIGRKAPNVDSFMLRSSGIDRIRDSDQFSKTYPEPSLTSSTVLAGVAQHDLVALVIRRGVDQTPVDGPGVDVQAHGAPAEFCEVKHLVHRLGRVHFRRP
jgi:hypothetical protein